MRSRQEKLVAASKNSSEKQSTESSRRSRSKKKKEVPRKCAKIRRTYPAADVEKTELRFVVYNKNSGKYERENFLRDVAKFLDDQATHMQNRELPMRCKRRPSVSCSSRRTRSSASNRSRTPLWRRMRPRSADSRSMCIPRRAPSEREQGIVLVRDLKKNRKPCIPIAKDCHHKEGCPRAAAVQKSIPLVRIVIEKITEVNKRHQRKDLESIRATAQQTLDDAELTLKEGGNLGKTIIDRIMRVSEMARHVLPPRDTSSTCVSSSTKVTVSKGSFRR